MQEFAREHSKTLSGILGMKELARGGEAVVYRVEHTGVGELIVKCPLVKPELELYEVATMYDSIIYESQTLKLVPFKNNIA